MANLITTWEELSRVPDSEAHRLEVNPKSCNGWVVAKKPSGSKFSDTMKYLSTHTFYGEKCEYSTRLLQSCGFDVEIDNWDK